MPYKVRRGGEPPSKIMALWLGESGAGKTHLSASAGQVEELSPVLLIDIDGGSSTVSKYPDWHVTVATPDDYRDVLKILHDVKRETLTHEGLDPFKTVVLDGLSELQFFNLADIIKMPHTTGRPRDPEVPELQDYMRSTVQFRRLLRQLKHLIAQHVIVTCLAAYVEDQATGIVTVTLGLTRKLRQSVPAAFDIVGYLYAEKGGARKETTRKLRTTPTARYPICKTRVAKLPGVLENPSMSKILELSGRFWLQRQGDE